LIRALIATCLLAASPATAASWATKDVCTVTELTIPDTWLSAEERRAISDRAAEIPNAVGRLWRLEAPNGAVSHLFGTMHVNAPILLDLPPESEEILKTTRIIAPEIDNRLSARRFAFNDTQESLRWSFTRGDTAESPFEPELESWVPVFFSGYGLERPWEFATDAGIAEMLLWDVCGDFNAGVFPIMDDLVMLEARIAGAQIMPLEPKDTFLRDLSETRWAEGLNGILQVYGAYTQPAEDNTFRQASFTLYHQGRIGEMMADEELYIAEVFGEERGLAFLAATDDYLLRERNERWLDGIAPELDLGGVTMSVGSFHLPGATGLIELLRARGFTVTRIVATGEVSR